VRRRRRGPGAVGTCPGELPEGEIAAAAGVGERMRHVLGLSQVGSDRRRGLKTTEALARCSERGYPHKDLVCGDRSVVRIVSDKVDNEGVKLSA